MTQTQTPEFKQALDNKWDVWVSANGGTETTTTTRTGDRVLYCFNPATGNHAYVDVASDMAIDDNDLYAYGLV